MTIAEAPPGPAFAPPADPGQRQRGPLPLAIDLLSQIRTGAGAAADPTLGHAKIMIVDDEPSTVDIVRVFLAELGYSRLVTTSESSAAAELLARTRPDLLLLDLQMPEVSGFDLLRAMKADPQIAHTPVIVLTSSTDAQDKLRALELGAADFLGKPVNPSELALRTRNNLAAKTYYDRVLHQQAAAEQLLEVALPRYVVERLRRGQPMVAERFEDTTVLIASLVNFSDFASASEAENVVETLNYIFGAFDDLVRGRGLEKIRTSGHTYVMAGGVPSPTPGQAREVVELGLQMAAFTRELPPLGPARLALSVGVSSGPVVAGVIGQERFSYDVWGETVNLARQLEAEGVPGRVRISEATALALDGALRLSPNVPLERPGQAALPSYLVDPS